MCFSANSSFAMAGMLIVIGTLALQKIKSLSQLPFSLIPYFFAIQQISEGLLWISLGANNFFSNQKTIIIFSYVFLFFALFMWPIWIPFSIYSFEKNKIRKNLILLTLIVGIIVSLFLGYFMIANGVKAEIISKHIFYDVRVPNIFNVDILFYLIATVLPFFLSSIPLLWLFGIFALISLYITYYFYINFLISIWCFCAAFLSIFVYMIIKKSSKYIK
jgi:hypothetical protein